MAITRQKDPAGSEPDKGDKPPREKPQIKVAADAAKEDKPKEKKKDKSEGGIQQLQQFLKEVVIEFRKITWPPRRDIIKTTYSVLFLIAVITLAVLAFDYLVAQFFFGPIEHWARLHGGGVGLSH